MNKLIKLSALCVAGVAMVTGFSGSAQAAGPYSCTNETYSDSYSTCTTNNTANQSSTVATASTILRAASTQTAKLVSNRVSAALGGDSASFNVASNGFSASSGISAGNNGREAGIWISGSWTDVENEGRDAKFDGNTYSGIVGIDFRATPDVVLGISVGYEDVDIDTEYNGFNGVDGNIEGDGFTVAPYIGIKLGDNLNADLSAGYSNIDYDTLRFDPNTGRRITGSTDADRYFVNAGISGVHDLKGNWRAKVRGSVFYASEEKDAFTETESNGATIAVAEEKTELGQFLFDTRLGYVYEAAEPYVLVGLEYDFTKDDAPVAAGQTQSLTDDFGAKFGAGINLRLGSNVTGGVEAYTVEFRDDYNEYAVTGGLRVKF